jgi:hypothetical protein
MPFASDPRMHREDEWTLARVASEKADDDPRVENQNVETGTSVQDETERPSSTHHHRLFVFTDPVAFRYLEEDASTSVLERKGRLKGYQVYLVEQWACSRVHPTFVITTFTGDESHFVWVGVLRVPADESSWSPRLRVYFKAISQFHARPKDTPLGSLMVTNLSGFPSALTVIPVPDGDIKKHREDFIVNEDLKRLGCSGRAGLNLAPPTAATQAKFHQLYKTSESIKIYSAVIELVKLCQVGLLMFGKLEQEYADGLLCDVTERAINDWWTEFGSEYYNIEPTDGILGPTTVAALLGMLMGARNRLNYCGAPVAKDVFDIVALKRGINHFQKQQKLDRTRRLDRQTLACLRRVTAKAAAGEGWAVPKAVKSTVAELSGKGGEMVMDMVRTREKAGISDIETLDFDRFVSLVHGERSKWLWYGKRKRSGTGDNFGRPLPELGNMIFSKDDQGGYVWSSKKSDTFPLDDEVESRRRDSKSPAYSSRPIGSTMNVLDSPAERDQQLRKNVLKSVTGKMSDARSGFGRIKDAVGLRGHASRHSKDEGTEIYGPLGSYFSPSSSRLDPASVGALGSGNVAKTFSWKTKPEEYQNGFRKDHPLIIAANASKLRDSESPQSDSKLSLPLLPEMGSSEVQESGPGAETKWAAQVKEIRRDLVAVEPSVAGSVYGEGDLEVPLLEAERDPEGSCDLLHRRHSIGDAMSRKRKARNESWWPRHLSFSDVEEAVFVWNDIASLPDDDHAGDGMDTLKKERYLAEDYKVLYARIMELQNYLGQWVEKKVENVEALDSQARTDQDGLQTLFFQLSEAYQNVQQNSQDILSDERSRLNEAIKDIEVLGAKLEYEINALVSKVEDVEDGVNQFEGQVIDLESRAAELEQLLQTEGWLHWAVRSITGIGIGPHIQR